MYHLSHEQHKKGVSHVRHSHRGFTMIELLVVIAIIGMLVGALVAGRPGGAGGGTPHPGVNNLKQLGLAMLAYHDQLGSFPPTTLRHKVDPSCDACGYGALFTFRTMILPQLEQGPLFNAINFSYEYLTWGTGEVLRRPREFHGHGDGRGCLCLPVGRAQVQRRGRVRRGQLQYQYPLRRLFRQHRGDDPPRKCLAGICLRSC